MRRCLQALLCRPALDTVAATESVHLALLQCASCSLASPHPQHTAGAADGILRSACIGSARAGGRGADSAPHLSATTARAGSATFDSPAALSPASQWLTHRPLSTRPDPDSPHTPSTPHPSDATPSEPAPPEPSEAATRSAADSKATSADAYAARKAAEAAEEARQRAWDEEDDNERLTTSMGPEGQLEGELELPSTVEVVGMAAGAGEDTPLCTHAKASRRQQ